MKLSSSFSICIAVLSDSISRPTAVREVKRSDPGACAADVVITPLEDEEEEEEEVTSGWGIAVGRYKGKGSAGVVEVAENVL